MTTPTFRRRALAAALIAITASAAVVPLTYAQQVISPGQRARDRAAAAAKQAEAQAQVQAQSYPRATRQVSAAQATPRGTTQLQRMVDLYEESKPQEALARANEIIGNEKANAYERAFAAQFAARIAYEQDQVATAIDYLNRALQFDGLDNNGHYGAMLMLAQLQLQEDRLADALATFDRFFAETGSDAPEPSALKASALYRLDRHAEAIPLLEQAIAASPKPRPDWQQVLMAAYAESGQSDRASKLAEEVAAQNPDDQRTQLNLVATYFQTDQYDKAAAVLERMRAAGQLTDNDGYRQLYSTYLNMEGKELQAAEVIEEGLAKGILKPDFQLYLAQAQSYYFSEQHDKAIEAYRKAAPLAPDGETYLNLARALWAADRIPEAKQAAQQALDKGVRKADDAKRILALSGS